MSDTITIIKTLGNVRMTKLWRADGSIEGYGEAKNFKIKSLGVNSLQELAGVLGELVAQPQVCVIRGTLKVDSAPDLGDYPNTYLRRSINFNDVPHHWMMCDIDGYSHENALEAPTVAIDAFVAEHLPPAFNGASYVWQLSSSAGRVSGELKAHVWFWLKVPASSAQLRPWGQHLPIDQSVFNTVQAHYTAGPVFEDGVEDPVPARFGFSTGWFDEVDLDLADVAPQELERREDGDYELVDPREKPGVVGAFCRAFTIEEVLVRWLSGRFRFQHDDDDRRLTYKIGHGAVGGAFITNDRLHVVNKHATDPGEGRALNAFDLVRVHKFGHLDEGADVLDLVQIQGRPSHVAMVELCKALPEVGGELDAGKALAVSDWESRIAQAGLSEMESLAADIGHDAGLVDTARLIPLLRDRFRALGVAMPVADLRRLLHPRARQALPDVSPDGAPQQTIENVRTVLENEGVHVRYNCINKREEILIPKMTWSMDNVGEASLAHVRSLCHRYDVKTNYLKSMITAIADGNIYNPVVTWVTSKPWDGVSRLQDFYDTLVETPGAITKDAKHLMMRKWLIQTVAAAFAPDGVMGRGVLTLMGRQYLGKTRWLLSLAPADLGVISVGKNLNVHDKDSLMQVLGCWIAELGELDATFKKSDISALKAFLTQVIDEIRRPYAALTSRQVRRTSFFATVNDPEFLTDQTGNTRFWVIPVDAVLSDHDVDMQQLWAEVLELWVGGEVHWMTQGEMVELGLHNEQFEQGDPIIELVTDGLNWSSFSPERFKWMSASEVLRWLGMANPSKRDATVAANAILKLNGKNKKRSNSTRYLAVPVSRAEGGLVPDDTKW